MGISSAKGRGTTEISRVGLSVERSRDYREANLVHPVVSHLRAKYGPEQWQATDKNFFTHSVAEENFVNKDLVPLNQRFSRHAWLVAEDLVRDVVRPAGKDENKKDDGQEEKKHDPPPLTHGVSKNVVLVVYIMHLQTTLVLLATFPPIDRSLSAAGIPKTVSVVELERSWPGRSSLSRSVQPPSVSSSKRASHSPATPATPHIQITPPEIIPPALGFLTPTFQRAAAPRRFSFNLN